MTLSPTFRAHHHHSANATPCRAISPAMPQPTTISKHLYSSTPYAAHTSTHPATQISLRALSFTSTSIPCLPSWTLSLERGIGKAYGSEAELLATGAFQAEVFPDLPIATTWQNLAKALMGSLRPSSPSPSSTPYTVSRHALKVITVAANLRSPTTIERRLLAAAGEGVWQAEVEGGRAGALLCVSGSHPVRSLPLVPRFLSSSLDTLRLAARLKQLGLIPAATQLWVVANPNTERDGALLEAKAELGASTVLTQPPLDWPAYLSWLDDVQRRGLLMQPSTPPPDLPPAHSPSPQHPTPSVSSIAQHPVVQPPLQPQPPQEQQTLGPPPPTDNGSAAATGGGGGPMRLLVGHPMISSAANLSFWLSLIGCSGSEAARRLLAEAVAAETGTGGSGEESAAAAAAAYMLSYNRRLVKQILERGGATGLHVMPITKASKKIVLGMLQDGSLPRSEND